MAVIAINKILEPDYLRVIGTEMKGNEQIKRVFIGVFKPIKSSVCLSSLLNLANRKCRKNGDDKILK